MYCSGSSSSMATSLLQQKNCMKTLSNGGGNTSGSVVNSSGVIVTGGGVAGGAVGDTIQSQSVGAIVGRALLPHEMAGMPVVPIASSQSSSIFSTGHSTSNLINLNHNNLLHHHHHQQQQQSSQQTATNYYHCNNTTTILNNHNYVSDINQSSSSMYNQNHHHLNNHRLASANQNHYTTSTSSPVVSYHNSNAQYNSSASFETGSTTIASSNHHHQNHPHHNVAMTNNTRAPPHDQIAGHSTPINGGGINLGNSNNEIDDGTDGDDGRGGAGGDELVDMDNVDNNCDMDMEPAPEIDIVINNVVCSFSVRCHLNLREIALSGFNVEFRRENGMVTMKLRRPYTTASIWSSGRITCTGATSEDQAKIAARRYSRCLQKLGFNVRFQNFRVVNVLGTCSMPWAIKIINFSEKYKKDAYYEPELHPGVTYKLLTPKATLKIFSTGSITVTASSVASVQAAIEHIFPLVYEFRKERSAEAVALMKRKAAAKLPLCKAYNDPDEDIMYVSDQEGLPGVEEEASDDEDL